MGFRPSGGWLRSPKCPRADVSLLMGCGRAQMIQGSDDPDAHPLADGARSWGLIADTGLLVGKVEA